MQDKKNLGSLLSCPILSIKLASGMDFQLLWAQGEHEPVIRVWHRPESGPHYPEFSVSHQNAYSSSLQFCKTNQLAYSPQHWPLVWRGDPDFPKNKIGKALV